MWQCAARCVCVALHPCSYMEPKFLLLHGWCLFPEFSVLAMAATGVGVCVCVCVSVCLCVCVWLGDTRIVQVQ